MLAGIMRRAQLAELALWAALSWWLVRRGWSVAAALAAIPALVLGTRWLLVCAMFTLAWIHRAPRAPAQRIGAGAACAMVLREYVAFLSLAIVRTPWEHRVLRADPPDDAPGELAIVLVHGFFVNRGCWAPTVRALEREGLGPIYVPNCRSWLAPIERFEEDLHACIERVARGRRVALVAHSMGGLAARLYLARRGATRVARLVTIGSPHQGTRLATWGWGANARQMQPGSAFLASLEAHEAASEKPPALAIHSAHDDMITPQDSARLAWARNVEVTGLGHISQFASGAIVRAVAEELRRSA